MHATEESAGIGSGMLGLLAVESTEPSAVSRHRSLPGREVGSLCMGGKRKGTNAQ